MCVLLFRCCLLMFTRCYLKLLKMFAHLPFQSITCTSNKILHLSTKIVLARLTDNKPIHSYMQLDSKEKAIGFIFSIKQTLFVIQ